ncbi:MAG: DUF167 domain-containing protein, partial [Armatimonadetes bacterium]|nr:DUF167 domain-containing protein [Armatimonadota bacterium]
MKVRVTPRASRNSVEPSDDGLRVYTTSAPADGQANESVVRLVAKALNVPKSRIAIKRGRSSRDKLLSIDGLGPEELQRRISRLGG